jgi:hypothetical protein
MFSKVITLMFFVTCAVAQFPPGNYQIFNIQPELQRTPVRGTSNRVTNVKIPEPRLPPSPADVVSYVIIM